MYTRKFKMVVVMLIINKKFYHKVKNNELEDNAWNFVKRMIYENITFASDVKKINNFNYSGNLKSVIVPGTVNEIENDCFSNCKNIEEVILNEGIQLLGTFSFYDCRQLKSITIPKSVKSIGRFCFSACYNLEEVILQEGLETIDDRCFFNCENLKIISIPSSVNSLGFECFGQCRNLEKIVLPPNFLDVPKEAFNGCDNIKYVDYQSLNIEFLMTIKERLKKEKRIKKVEQLSQEVMKKLFYFGKCKLLEINYKQEYEEFIEYYIDTYSVPNKNMVSLDKNSYLKNQDNKQTKLIPWYLEYIPGYIPDVVVLEDNEYYEDKKLEQTNCIEEHSEHSSLANIVDDEYYNIGDDVYVRSKNGSDDDIMPKIFAKEFIKKK